MVITLSPGVLQARLIRPVLWLQSLFYVSLGLTNDIRVEIINDVKLLSRVA